MTYGKAYFLKGLYVLCNVASLGQKIASNGVDELNIAGISFGFAAEYSVGPLQYGNRMTLEGAIEPDGPAVRLGQLVENIAPCGAAGNAHVSRGYLQRC